MIAQRVPVLPQLSPASPYSYANPYGNMYSNSGQYGSNYDQGAMDLYGAAEVINSQGRVMVNQQQAFLTREQVRAKRIANRRKDLDEFLYEREKAPTPEDDRQRLTSEQVRRAQDPTATEIWSGQALNDLLADLRRPALRTDAANAQAFPVPLNADQLKRVNVTSGNGSGNIALLKREGPLAFPAGLTGPDFEADRERVNSLAQKAVAQAASPGGRVDSDIIEKLNREIDLMQQILRRKSKDLPPSFYMEARTYLTNLGDAVRALAQKDAANYFNGKYSLTAKTIPELVAQMNERGLQFAPVAPGGEAAYNALHQALAAYDSEVRSPSSRKVQ
jgi:hypothetical protein